jgi:hypothetical protein
MNTSFVVETTNMIKPKLYMSDNGIVPYTADFFMWIRNPRFPPLQGINLSPDPRGEIIIILFILI